MDPRKVSRGNSREPEGSSPFDGIDADLPHAGYNFQYRLAFSAAIEVDEALGSFDRENGAG